MTYVKVVIFVIILILLATYFFPIKFAIKLDDYSKNTSDENDILVCVHAQVTGGDWGVLKVLQGDTLNTNTYIDIIGDVPPKQFYQFGIGNNFIFVGHFIGEEDKGGEIVKVFSVNRWEILSPIKRNTIVPRPNSYLTMYDFIGW